jgi:hypothetical protein
VENVPVLKQKESLVPIPFGRLTNQLRRQSARSYRILNEEEHNFVRRFRTRSDPQRL